MAKDIAELQEQAERILEMAKAKGAQSNYFFTTSFHRYQMQIQILSGLEAAIEEYGTMISKINVKGGEMHIVAENNSAENKYIQGVWLNGKEYRQPWISHSDLTAGGELRFEMGSEPTLWY